MKKLVAFLLACSILLSLSAAFAAGMQIKAQPVSSDTIVLKVKVSGNHYIGWFFVNPENGEEIAGADLPKTFKTLKVSGSKTATMTLKNVPAELNGWEVYCRLANKKKTEKVESDHFVIYAGGLYPLDYRMAAAATETEPAETPAETPAAEEAAPQVDGNGDPIPQTITVSGSNVTLVPLDSYGEPLEDQAGTVLSFEGTGSLVVRADGTVKYWTVNGIRIDPEESVTSIKLRDVDRDLVISASVSGSSAAVAETGEMVQVTCEGCVFSCKKANLTAVTSGSVPAGATITVIIDDVKAADKGYSINGGPAENKGQSSFRVQVTEDTTIKVNP